MSNTPNLSQIESFLCQKGPFSIHPKDRAALRESAIKAITKGEPIRTNGLCDDDRKKFVRLVIEEAYKRRVAGQSWDAKKDRAF